MSRAVRVPRTFQFVAVANYRNGAYERVTGEAHGSTLGEAMDNAELERIESPRDPEDVVRIVMEVWET